MDFLKKIFGQAYSNEPAQRIKITQENLHLWEKFEKLFKEGKIKSDSHGRLRYLHGAPVGELILIRVNKDGTAIYKESREEYFGEGSPKAEEFIWP